MVFETNTVGLTRLRMSLSHESLVVVIKDPRFTMSGLRFWVQFMSGIVSVVTTFLSVLDVANLGSQIMLA